MVAAPTLRPNEVLALAGSGKALKEWNKVVPFDGSNYPYWTLALNVTEPFAYKILIADKETLAPVAWEDGENRWFAALPQENEVVVEADLQVRFSGRDWKGAGTAIPVFSLRTEDDFGVGEFYDLKKMVDWAAATGRASSSFFRSTTLQCSTHGRIRTHTTLTRHSLFTLSSSIFLLQA